MRRKTEDRNFYSAIRTAAENANGTKRLRTARNYLEHCPDFDSRRRLFGDSVNNWTSPVIRGCPDYLLTEGYRRIWLPESLSGSTPQKVMGSSHRKTAAKMCSYTSRLLNVPDRKHCRKASPSSTNWWKAETVVSLPRNSLSADTAANKTSGRVSRPYKFETPHPQLGGLSFVTGRRWLPGHDRRHDRPARPALPAKTGPMKDPERFRSVYGRRECFWIAP